MVSSVDPRTSFKHSTDATPASATLAAAISTRKIVHEMTPMNGDSTAATDAGLNLCRCKTGRCTNARVAKPNRELLLLCEFHRNQQNRTKKRSDMKYRQDRAKKRMVERQQVTKSSPRALPTPDPESGDIDAHKSKKKKSARTHRNRRSEKLKAFADLFSLTSPHKERGDSLFFVSSNSFSNSSRFEVKRGCLSSRGATHSSVLNLDLDDANIMINSPTVRSLGDVDATFSLFPFCVSPLSSARRCGEPFWQPDDMRLLEYFIL